MLQKATARLSVSAYDPDLFTSLNGEQVIQLQLEGRTPIYHEPDAKMSIALIKPLTMKNAYQAGARDDTSR